MSTVAPTPSPQPPPSVATPPSAAPSLGAVAREWWSGVRTGELGALPIVVGLVVIAIVFQTQNSNFLTAGNFVNLIVQAAAITTIAMGIVFVLLLGEIDLSVGYVSGVGGVLAALLVLPGGSYELGGGLAIVIALVAGLLIGTLHGVIITKVGIPSFVVTLAGYLAWNGAVLLLIGSRGTVVIQSKLIVNLANGFVGEGLAWALVALVVLGYAGQQVYSRGTRRRAGLPAEPVALPVLRVLALAVVAAVVVDVSNQDRGVPYILLVLVVLFGFWTFVLKRTTFGRHVFAVGGNAEAARRAGIDVDRIRIACFAICSMMAALGGVVLASRLSSVDTSAGGGTILLYSIAAAVIGGTSLFGGRGTILSAVLGALVIASIDNGLGLLGLSSGTKFVITGLVLLLAVTVDSVSRRGRENAGRS